MGGESPAAHGSAMTALAENLEKLEDAIAQACRRAGRRREEIELMAVSKTFPAEAIAAAAGLGITLFGENRVQEFAAKALHSAEPESWVPQVRGPHGLDFVRGVEVPVLGPGRVGSWRENVRVHLIGHLQSNKSTKAAELFDGIDSLDSVRLAQRLDEAAGELGKRLPVLIEVKLSPEQTKSGVEPKSEEAAQLFEGLAGFAHLEVRGLMTIAPWGAPEDETRACFRSLHEWRDRWARAYPKLNLDVLSMGMSGDFPLAIEEGATRIRIGTALFGKRTLVKDSD
jgi:PLP dependent protein